MIHWQKYVDVERSNDVTLGEAFDKVPSASWNLLISSLFENKIGKKKENPIGNAVGLPRRYIAFIRYTICLIVAHLIFFFNFPGLQSGVTFLN